MKKFNIGQQVRYYVDKYTSHQIGTISSYNKETGNYTIRFEQNYVILPEQYIKPAYSPLEVFHDILSL